MLQKIKLTLLLIASIPLFLSLEACRKPISEAGIKKTIVGKWQEKNSDFIIEFTADGEAFSYPKDGKRGEQGTGRTSYKIQKDQLIYEGEDNKSSIGTRIIEKLNKKELIIKFIYEKNDRETITKYKRVQ